MRYTVKQLAKIAGVSIRTLHYYDEIGLLKPAFIKANGYRYYEEKELVKLQQILFFRELEFALDEIIQMVNAADFDILEALADQKKLLELKKARIERLVGTINVTIKNLKEGANMQSEDLFSSFTDQHGEQYKDEVKAKWGKTRAYKQSVERTKRWTKEDFERIKDEGNTITHTLSRLMGKGIADPEVQAVVERHFQHINQFYDCSYAMYRELGVMYVNDTRFADNYNKLQPHLAEFMRDAIAYYCDQQQNNSMSG